MRALPVLAVALLSPIALGGCSAVEKVPDEDLAANIRVAAKGAAQYGLGYVLNKDPGRAAQVAEGARLAARILRDNIVPAFSGQTTGEVFRSAVETALEELSSKLTPQVVLAVQLALDVVAANVRLPENPSDRIAERTRLALLGLFSGLAEGLDAAASLAPARETPPAKLFWPKP